MPCVVVLLAIISPRLAILAIAIFTNRFDFAFDSWWMPTLGFFLLPWTTLAWVIAYTFPVGVTEFGWFVVIFAFVIDVLAYAGSGHRRAVAS